MHPSLNECSGNQNSSVYGLAHKRPTQESLLEPKGAKPVALTCETEPVTHSAPNPWMRS